MPFLLIMSLLVLTALPAAAADKSVSFYLDGARIDMSVIAAKEYAEVALPAAAIPGSLRVKPVGRIAIERVEITAAPATGTKGRSMEKLTQRKEQLEDRLQALATREQIFTASAKSQSGKTLRKTKGNPEPLTAVRQGTEYAISQLEWVYQARRKAENELRLVTSRLEAEKKAGNIGGTVARIWTKGGGKVNISYLVTDLRWLPVYDFRLDGEGEVRVRQRASFPAVGKGVPAAVVHGLTTDVIGADQYITVSHHSLPVVGELTLPLEASSLSASAQPGLTFSTTNVSTKLLPAGDASCYYRGEYVGRFSFNGLASGESKSLKCGN